MVLGLSRWYWTYELVSYGAIWQTHQALHLPLIYFFNFIIMSSKREKELTHHHHKPVDCYHLELPANSENQWYPGKKTWMKFECIWSQEFGNCWRWTSTKALVTLTTISVKAWCSQQIKMFPFPSYPFTTSATQSGSSRSQDMSTVILRSVASGCTVSRGRARFPP